MIGCGRNYPSYYTGALNLDLQRRYHFDIGCYSGIRRERSYSRWHWPYNSVIISPESRKIAEASCDCNSYIKSLAPVVSRTHILEVSFFPQSSLSVYGLKGTQRIGNWARATPTQNKRSRDTVVTLIVSVCQITGLLAHTNPTHTSPSGK